MLWPDPLAEIPHGLSLTSCKSDLWQPTTLLGPPPLHGAQSSPCRWTSRVYLRSACLVGSRRRASRTASSSLGGDSARGCSAASLTLTSRQQVGMTGIRRCEDTALGRSYTLSAWSAFRTEVGVGRASSV